MKFRKMIVLVLLAGSFGLINAQNTLDDVHLFQSFFRDAPISASPYVDGGIGFSTYEYANMLNIFGRGGYAVNEKIEIGAGVGFLNMSPEHGDSQSGLQDLFVSGKYRLNPFGNTKLSAGGYITLPIGSDKVGQSRFDFGAFAAARHPLENGMVITGTLGLDFIETTKVEINDNFELEESTEYKTSLLLGAGVIYPHSDQINIVGEFQLKTEGDYIFLTGGADYKLNENGRVRGVIGLGLDDGAPDFMIMGSYLLNL